MTLQDDIDRAVYGRRRGGRYRVAPPEERTADGIVFDSKHEMEFYLLLKSMLQTKAIRKIERQVEYCVHVHDVTTDAPIYVFSYFADFVVTERHGAKTVYDAKGHRTAEYKLKKRCVEAEHGITIVEV